MNECYYFGDFTVHVSENKHKRKHGAILHTLMFRPLLTSEKEQKHDKISCSACLVLLFEQSLMLFVL